MSITVTGTDAVRAQLLRLGQNMPRQVLAETAEATEDYIRQEAGRHFKQGQLNSSIFKQRQSDEAWLVGHDARRAPHALFVIGGTRPHTIAPRNKRALRYARNGVFWFWFGPQSSKQDKARIYAWLRKSGYGSNTKVMFKWPHHPGYRGDDWMQRAASVAVQKFSAFAQAYIDQQARG